jgi:hypothetical protein
MLAAMVVVLLGAGLTALGLLVPTMYDIGIMVMLLGIVGVGIRSIDLLHWLRR